MKAKFIELYNTHICRGGAEDLLRWLESTDFFTAPASTRYHLSRAGGLVEHSIHVYERLVALVKHEEAITGKCADVPMETIAICGLLHDVCKVNIYKTEMRNTKDETGHWIKVPYYTVDDQLPYGHGEKSVYIISGFMKLTREEAFAIRYHMGAYDGGNYHNESKAFEKFPIALLTHIADMQATHIDEKDSEANNA